LVFSWVSVLRAKATDDTDRALAQAGVTAFDRAARFWMVAALFELIHSALSSTAAPQLLTHLVWVVAFAFAIVSASVESLKGAWTVVQGLETGTRET
jgi:hypothetical protein